MHKEIIIAGIATVVAVLIASPLVISTVQAHGVTGKSVILRDNAYGNARGWNPDGNKNTFWISDTSVSPLRSTVLVDTKQLNWVNCAVDYMVSGAFEVQCIKVKPGSIGQGGPSNGGELHYIVFNRPFIVFPGDIVTGGVALPDEEDDPALSVDVLSTIKNRTQGVEGVAELSPEQTMLAGLSANRTDVGQ